MAKKIGFKPKWTERDIQVVEAFAKKHTGKEPGLGPDEYVKWLYGKGEYVICQ